LGRLPEIAVLMRFDMRSPEMASCYVWDCNEPTIMPQSIVGRMDGQVLQGLASAW